MSVRILLADDHRLVRRGIRLLLEEQPDFTVVAEADDGAAALRAGLERDVDLALLDVAMPRLTGIHVARQLIAHRPGTRVVILSMHDDEQFLVEAIDAGAAGYVLKSAAHEELIDACRGALRGESFAHPKSLAAHVRGYIEGRMPDGPRNPLTPRETEVVKLIAEGLNGREIADVLVISEKTVERHRSNVLEKLGLRDRVALTRWAMRRGLIEP